MRQRLSPHVTDNPKRLRLAGPPIALPANLATPFGLVLHELATNAAKYGSLSASAGSVDLNWTIHERNNKRVFRVVWQEGGGPSVAKAATEGFGSVLIDSVFQGAEVAREFRPDGFVCTIELALPEAADDGQV